MSISFSICGTQRHAGIAFTGRKRNDPINTTRSLTLVKSSQQNYQIEDDSPK